MIDAELTDACFGFICDAGSAAAAHQAGVGATVELELGGHYDDMHGTPLRVSAYVKALHDGRSVSGLDYIPQNEFVMDAVGTSDERHFADLGIEYYTYVG